jgi:flagellar hook-associated protein 2
MAGLSSPGIGSNLDVNGIVSKLMSVEQAPINLLNKKEASYQAKLSAYGSIMGALGSFQGAVSGLSDMSKLNALTATSSDSTVLSASAASTAVAGTYAINVTSLAQSQKLVAAGQTSTTATIGTGGATTLTFDFGTIAGGTFSAITGKYTGSTYTSNGAGTKTVTIDATNNSLQGMRDAINAANIGVTATIVNDGSPTPYRLSLASNALGSTNSIKISAAGDATVSGLLAQDPAAAQNLSETVTAQNANFNINGIAVSKASNTVTDAIQGVTLNLLKITTATTNLTVARDTSTLQSSVAAFVKGYNDLNKVLRDASSYNATTKQGAILQGDSTVRSLQTQLRGVMNTPLTNSSSSLTNLTQIGVTFQKDGTAITNNFSDVASLFATVGKASDSLVSYTTATTSTKLGSYAVNVATLATQGNAVGNFNLNTGLNTIAANTTINVTLDGASASVALTAGSYTATQLAAMTQSAINGTAAFSSAGSTVAATIDASGFMHVVSNRYGATSAVSMASNTGTLVSAFMGAATNAAGVDVAGTIAGIAATGSGQFLTSSSGNSLGLKIQINGGATGARGAVNYSQGYAFTLNNLATSLLASGGPLDGAKSGINRSITDIGKQRDVVNRRLVDIEARYRKQFTALDVMIGSMNTTSTYLTTQLANLPKPY